MHCLRKLIARLICTLAISLCCLATAIAQTQEGKSSIETSRCIEGPTQAAATRTARPNRTVECPYGFDELVALITRLSSNSSIPDSVEAVEEVLGLPAMTTSGDEQQLALYSMTLTGITQPGKDGWRLFLLVQEAFPLDKGHRGFGPGPRPRRLQPVEDANLRVDILVRGSSSWGAERCVPVSPFLDALLATGWRNVVGNPAPMDGPEYPMLGYDRKTVSILGARGSCAQNIALEESARR